MSTGNKTALYDYITVDLADPRTNDWFLVKHPWVNCIVAIYLLISLKIGPRWMKKRKAYELKTTLLIYNLFQVLLSIWLFSEGFSFYWNGDIDVRCQPVDYTTSPSGMRIARFVYVYYMAKISELLDTVFFVLRKKDSQVSFLHVYHHSIMPLYVWVATKYYAGGNSVFPATINSFIHVLMYAYYLLAAMGPAVQKYLWWKKYLTTLQLVQFGVEFVHIIASTLYDCGYPQYILLAVLPNTIAFYYLFASFYKKAYNQKVKVR